MTFPNFLIIGAAKSGTSALYHYLRQHPDIFMSPRKETHFFAFYNKDPNTAGPGDTIPNAITNLDDYKSLFSKANHEQAIGEASPTYIYYPHAGDNIKNFTPDIKMIVILRNPVDRAYSAFMHLVRDGRETETDFRTALSLEEERMRNNWGPIWHYKHGGLYYQQLSYYFSIFTRNQFLVLLHDEFKTDPYITLTKIYRFLEVDENWVADISIKPNVSGNPRNMLLHKTLDKLLLKPNPIKYSSQILIPEHIRLKVTTKVRNLNLVKNPMSLDVRIELTDSFSQEIENLGVLLQRDLSFWLKPK